MATTYYLLRTKESAVGNGPYLGHNPDGNAALITNHQDARRFDSFEAAEEYASQAHEALGMFEIEVRNSAD